METTDPSIIGRERLHHGYLTVERVRIRLADGATVTREIERHGDAVAVLPYDPERRTALVGRLMRAPVLAASGEKSLEEACAGMVDAADADAEVAARREALEELGVALGVLERAGCVWPSPGVSSERASLFLAPYTPAQRVGSGGGLAAEREDVTVIERPLADLASDADAGLVADAKLLMLLQTLRLRRPDLFRLG